jgi:hypothetical protein
MHIAFFIENERLIRKRKKNVIYIKKQYKENGHNF